MKKSVQQPRGNPGEARNDTEMAFHGTDPSNVDEEAWSEGIHIENYAVSENNPSDVEYVIEEMSYYSKVDWDEEDMDEFASHKNSHLEVPSIPQEEYSHSPSFSHS